MARARGRNRWWRDDPRERYWVEAVSERRPTLGEQLHAPQQAGGGEGRQSWSYALIAEPRPGDVVLHWLGDTGFVGWSIVAGEIESLPIEWRARGTYGRRRPPEPERPGWRVPLRDLHELQQPIGLDELRAHRQEVERVHAALADRHPGSLYLALTLYEPPRGVEVGQGYLFKWPAALNEVFPGLRGMGQFTEGEPDGDARSAPVESAPDAGRRPRRRREHRFKKAAELHAVTAAMSWYASEGYEVEDVGDTESWDLEVARGQDVRRVEVKGSARVRLVVELTKNEVRNAVDWTPTDLFVVDSIELNDLDGVITTAGGRVRRWADWIPAPDSLEPLTYNHLLHPDPELHDVVTSIEYTAD